MRGVTRVSLCSDGKKLWGGGDAINDVGFGSIAVSQSGCYGERGRQRYELDVGVPHPPRSILTDDAYALCPALDQALGNVVVLKVSHARAGGGGVFLLRLYGRGLLRWPLADLAPRFSHLSRFVGSSTGLPTCAS